MLTKKTTLALMLPMFAAMSILGFIALGVGYGFAFMGFLAVSGIVIYKVTERRIEKIMAEPD